MQLTVYSSVHASKTRVNGPLLASTTHVCLIFGNMLMLDTTQNAYDKNSVRKQCEIQKCVRSGQKKQRKCKSTLKIFYV